MVASLQIGTVASYYASSYYHGGELRLGASWFARAGQFGLDDGSNVEAVTFEQLHAGLDLSGKQLVTTRGREVQGLDLCFSPAKSVSLVYALTDDARLRSAILEAHHKAVRAALAVIEDEAIYTRRGRGGLRREKAALTAALFTHDTARPEEHADGAVFASPQIHTHAVILNICRRADGTVGGIDTRLGPQKLLAGALYHAHLAAGVEALGFAVDEIGSNGTFELAGIAPELRSYFSPRREHIVEALKASGTTSGANPQAAAQAALSTRRSKKQDQADDERFSLWQTKARQLGFEPADVLALAEQAGREQMRRLENALAPRLEALPAMLTEREAAFPRRELLRHAAIAHVGAAAEPDRIVERANMLVADNLVREIRRSPFDEAIYSTPEMISIEAAVHELACELGAGAWRGLDRDGLARAAERAALSDEQHDAIQSLSEPTMLAFLEGRAGTGKTQALRPLVSELQAQGYRVIAAAQAWRTARMLEEELGIEAKAVDAWLAKKEAGGLFIDKHTVLLVDEAGLLGSRATFRLLKAVHEQGSLPGNVVCGTKLILIGDRKQLQPIAAGSGLGIVASAIDGAALTQVRRQRDVVLREAVAQLSRGEVAAAWSLLDGLSAIEHVQGSPAAIRAAVDNWEAEKKAKRNAEHLLLARTNASVRQLNFEARLRRRERGELAGSDVIIEATTPSGQMFSLSLAKGDRLRFGMRVDRLGVVNGTPGVVETVVTENDGHARIQARVGEQEIRFSTREIVDRLGRIRLAHDYAATISSAQGLTAESCTVLVETSFDRHDVYVAASRSRGNTKLVVDEHALELIARADRRIDVRGMPASAEERESALLKRLSRERLKESTLAPEHDNRDEKISPQTETLQSRLHRDRQPEREQEL